MILLFSIFKLLNIINRLNKKKMASQQHSYLYDMFIVQNIDRVELIFVQ